MNFDDKASLFMKELESLGWYWENEDELYLTLSKHFNPEHEESSFYKMKREQRKRELLKELEQLEKEEIK